MEKKRTNVKQQDLKGIELGINLRGKKSIYTSLFKTTKICECTHCRRNPRWNVPGRSRFET